MKFPTLYKYSTKGKLQSWTIETQANAFRTISGQDGGKQTTTAWTHCEGKNIGKANETSPEEQAEKEAQARWDKQQDNHNYRTSVDEIVSKPRYIEPMLAHDYKKRKDNINFNTTDVYVNIKYNGVRNVAIKGSSFSRKGKKQTATVEHINNALLPIFRSFPNLQIDGEIYNYQMRRNLGALISAINKKRPTPEQIAYAKKHAQYWIYDIIDTSMKYSERVKFIENMYELLDNEERQIIKIAPYWKVSSHKEIDAILAEAEEDGEEGVMVRLDEVYQQKRSYNLLKYKNFISEEFRIVKLIEGNGNLAGKVGAFVMEDEEGRTFNAAPIGKHDLWEEYWNNRDELIGQYGTVKFKEYTPITDSGGVKAGGIPNFGKFICVRNYE
jgi:DNA ligase-1